MEQLVAVRHGSATIPLGAPRRNPTFVGHCNDRESAGVFRCCIVSGRGGPTEQVEAQVDRGTVYASRTPHWTLAVVARRAALSSLMLMDLRAVLNELEGGEPIRRATAAATEEGADFESPVPELGEDDS